jgi:hypothetical protein
MRTKALDPGVGQKFVELSRSELAEQEMSLQQISFQT